MQLPLFIRLSRKVDSISCVSARPSLRLIKNTLLSDVDILALIEANIPVGRDSNSEVKGQGLKLDHFSNAIFSFNFEWLCDSSISVASKLPREKTFEYQVFNNSKSRHLNVKLEVQKQAAE